MPRMNPLLFANLSNQRRLLESGTAYATARLVINIGFALIAATGVVYAFIWLRMSGGLLLGGSGLLPDDLLFAIRALFIICPLAFLAALYVSWTAVRAFFDIADACILISLRGSEERPASSPGSPAPRTGGESWPEPPKPLIPIPETANLDSKYMPKG